MWITLGYRRGLSSIDFSKIGFYGRCWFCPDTAHNLISQIKSWDLIFAANVAYKPCRGRALKVQVDKGDHLYSEVTLHWQVMINRNYSLTGTSFDSSIKSIQNNFSYIQFIYKIHRNIYIFLYFSLQQGHWSYFVKKKPVLVTNWWNTIYFLYDVEKWNLEY